LERLFDRKEYWLQHQLSVLPTLCPSTIILPEISYDRIDRISFDQNKMNMKTRILKNVLLIGAATFLMSFESSTGWF